MAAQFSENIHGIQEMQAVSTAVAPASDRPADKAIGETHNQGDTQRILRQQTQRTLTTGYSLNTPQRTRSARSFFFLLFV